MDDNKTLRQAEIQLSAFIHVPIRYNIMYSVYTKLCGADTSVGNAENINNYSELCNEVNVAVSCIVCQWSLDLRNTHNCARSHCAINGYFHVYILLPR